MATSLAANVAAAVEKRQAGAADLASERSRPQTYWDLVDRSDEALLCFDPSALEHDEIEHARALLDRHPATYKNHLTIAQFIEG